MTGVTPAWRKRWSKRWIIAAVLIVLFAGWMIIFKPFSSKGSTPNGETAVSAKESESKASTCSPEFTQVALNRSGYQADPRYEGEIRPILINTSLSAEEKAAKIREVDLKLAGTNAQTLAAWVISLPALPYDNDSLNWRQLVEGGKIVDGGCLSEKGKQVWAEFKGALYASRSTGPGLATGNETNSGIENDVYGQAHTSGVDGDRSAVLYTFTDGTTWKRLIICGNPLFDTPPPKLPKVKTVNPPKEEPPEKLEEKYVEETPQRQGNMPSDYKPNPLERLPEHVQPTKPNNPPATYTQPAQPTPTVPSTPNAPKPADPAPGPAPSVEPNPTPIVDDPAPGPDW